MMDTHVYPFQWPNGAQKFCYNPALKRAFRILIVSVSRDDKVGCYILKKKFVSMVRLFAFSEESDASGTGIA